MNSENSPKQDRPHCFSVVYGALQGFCHFCHYASFAWVFGKCKYAYFYKDLFVMVWLSISFVVFRLSSSLTYVDNRTTAVLWALVVLLLYRCITMSFAHVNILLFDDGKTTRKKGKIHSRSRYLALTAFNYFEFLFWNSAISVWLQPINSVKSAYSEPFVSHVQVLYYSFVTITTLGYGDISPDPNCAIAQLQTVWGTTFSILILAVVINIVVNISKDDEACGA